MSIESVKAAIAVLTGEEEKKPQKRYCQLCEAEKAVGKYYVAPSESENHGWWRVCTYCAEMVSRVGADVQFYKYIKQPKYNSAPELPESVLVCSHDWVKWSLVGEHDKRRDQVFDWMRCQSCGVYGKRFSLGQEDMEDLSLEIDLNCSR
ncbi:TPA: hypothetical protein ACMDS2_003473 [Vibrio parahaemolyticus]|uniref:hypothetical protein n=1 Tax=Vibrio parahaemolyticus TaxID=670 RepID=UPI001D39F7F0|nr:hypothetical protein [Vibrio parahaemolyticus]EJG0471966.1 hypothetical protein [Vibrio parahaemolyticus]